MKIACIGAGPAGLYFSILMKLRDPDTEITMFERNPAGVTHGWGVVFWDDLVTDLRANDPVSSNAILDASFCWIDQVVEVKGGTPARGGGTGYGIGRQTLLDILRQRATDLGITIRYEHEITEPSQVPDADVIVAADGVGSHLRRLDEDTFEPRIDPGRNKYVWLGTSRVFEAFTFGLVPADAGWIWFHAYGYSPAMSTFIVECTPQTWQGLGFDRMPGDESLRLLERLFADYLGEHRLLSQSGEDDPLPWLNFRNLTNRRWHTGKVVLLGDAAHTTHFSIGSGTRLAMQDAIALADSLHRSKSVPVALAAYESERQLAMLRPQREARLSAAWFENIARYATLDGPQLFALLLDRRSRLIPRIPPRLYYALHRAKRIPLVRTLYRWAAMGLEQASGLPRRLLHP